MNRPSKGSINISDEQIVQSLQKNLKQMAELGIDCILFSPGAGAMGHDVGGELVSRYWTETSNELIARVCKLFPDKFIRCASFPRAPA